MTGPLRLRITVERSHQHVRMELLDGTSAIFDAQVPAGGASGRLHEVSMVLQDHDRQIVSTIDLQTWEITRRTGGADERQPGEPEAEAAPGPAEAENRETPTGG